ncbi:hypothetical protein [Steroidobacter cummioxidans]|uniref:hypothetical protein n=1 Tax=Steroidobacter cummioxidans TaxID=1803913 RepID=UPI000E31D039|nr:hypothetical protein [Steroidobacter cummioxidans]
MKSATARFVVALLVVAGAWDDFRQGLIEGAAWTVNNEAPPASSGVQQIGQAIGAVGSGMGRQQLSGLTPVASRNIKSTALVTAKVTAEVAKAEGATAKMAGSLVLKDGETFTGLSNRGGAPFARNPLVDAAVVEAKLVLGKAAPGHSGPVL